MFRPAPVILLAALAVALAGCNDAGADAPGGVSAGEAEALEQAAEMLDQRRLPPAALGPELASDAAPASAEMTGDAASPIRD